MPAETHDRGFAMTSSITTMMAALSGRFRAGDHQQQYVPGRGQSLPGDPELAR